ncbi:YggT family protein [Xanthobacter tagetidis]|jgi:YggT family protein|uniref:YggT family protein n=1 Tax=Xanthobacter tagetidis TaxID=60216 RepID=A0A3L7AM38_9HYPH|nr:YggT family protein [Xanthobacter tagetidis]MBB6309020.1 YggT family protein [Xanthobacter tagetidis]RLP80482.1 YggT family protein [Xanthobacter tagetidis]
MSASWAYHLPNFALAALMYTLIGRLLLSLIFAPNSTNYIYRAFVRLTDPLIDATRIVTPQIAPTVVVGAFTFIWLLILRVALLAAFALSGALPVAGGGAS